jgi:adenylate kinase
MIERQALGLSAAPYIAPNGAPKAVILFGPPGSGKGTQAKLIKQCMSVPHISTGDMLREHIDRGDSIGQRVRSLMQAGMLVSDELVNELVAERIGYPDAAKGFILDGYPRTLKQAQEMAKLLSERNIHPVVIHLLVDYNEVVARLAGRRVCPACGTLYSLTSNPPKVSGICDKDGTRLVTREDDSEPVIRQRLEEYDHLTRPLLEFFERSGVPSFSVKAGKEAPQAIANRICGLITQQ